jgi:hypothetical protein
MRSGVAGVLVVAILAFLANGCGERDRTSDAAARKDTMTNSLSPTRRARLDACLAQAVLPPWRVVRTQPFEKNLSVTIEARSEDLQLPHRQIQMRRQQYVELGIGQASLYTMPSAEQRRSQIASGVLQARSEVVGIAAAEFAPFVPYQDADVTLFLNIAGQEQCRYRAVESDRPNPFVECLAERDGYTVSLKFPHDAIAHLPRVFADARSLVTRVISCFDLAKDR